MNSEKPLQPSDYGVMLTTTSTAAEARMIAQRLIDEKLAACVQLLGIESFYVWQGETQKDPETLLLIKTRRALFEPAIVRIKELHSYTVPEIVAMPFLTGLPAYLNWIGEVTGPSKQA